MNETMPLDGVTDFHNHLESLSFHDPNTCSNPKHVVVEYMGQRWCGPGGWWPSLGEGLVYLKKDPIPLRGKLIR